MITDSFSVELTEGSTLGILDKFYKLLFLRELGISTFF